MRFEDKLRKITRMSKKFHEKLGKRSVNKTRKLLRSGKDVTGGDMAPYTLKYMVQKTSGEIPGLKDKYATRIPNLSLTGRMLNPSSFKLTKATKDGFTFGVSGKHGHKAIYHSGLGPDDKGKYLKSRYHRPITKPDRVVHPEVEESILKSYVREIANNIKKLPKKEIL
jgi:hypothetical protein